METTSNPNTTKPLTYGAAAKVATPVDTEQLVEILEKNHSTFMCYMKHSKGFKVWNLLGMEHHPVGSPGNAQTYSIDALRVSSERGAQRLSNHVPPIFVFDTGQVVVWSRNPEEVK